MTAPRAEPNEGAAAPRAGGATGERKILVVLPYSPRDDAPHGGRPFVPLLRALATRHRLAFLHLRHADEEPPDEELQRRCVFVQSTTIAERSRGRPGHALRRARALASGRPLQVDDYWSDEFAQLLRGVAERWRPDVIQLEPEALAAYLPIVSGAPGRRMLVLHEAAARGADEIWRASAGVERLVRFADWTAWRRFERRAAGLADAVVVLTERDAEGVRDLARGSPIHTVPLTVSLPPEPLNPLGNSRSVVFIGGFGHPPNVDAALALGRRIFPRIRARRPDSVLYLVGREPPPEIRALQGEGVVVAADVPDTTVYLDSAAVVVAPIRIGGGMRGKVLEALAAGKALVATARAVEGLPVVAGEQVLLATSDDEFADAVVRLLEDPDERRQLATAAHEWARSHFDYGAMVAAYERVYDELLDSP